ncbi:MAG: NADH-quinone oxidoreductase subunit N, partial [Sediminibacterium sp.]|nr:NADH-quinone oxidoreductase subunit N [Sediminibacterium sp.]
MCFNYVEAVNGQTIISFQTNFIELTKYSLIFNGLIFCLTFIYVWINGNDILAIEHHGSEAVALIFFTLCGASLLTSYNNLLILFLGIEMLTLPLYILTGINNQKIIGIEASIKYFIMGAFTTCILLLGIAFVYGAIGSFNIHALPAFIGNFTGDYSYLNAAGLILIFTAFSFKVSAAPFHFWTPDVYDGAPTIFTSYMATIIKIAGLFAFIKLFETQQHVLFNTFKILLIFIIIASFIIGNITALFQQSVKRMLAYSSIAQAGFMLILLFCKGDNIKEGVILYSVAYSLASMSIFAVLAKVHDLSFEGFNGFSSKQPVIAFCLSVCLLSLAGIPLTAGFIAKFYVLKNLIFQGGFLWLAIVAVIFSAIGLVYYLRLIQAMYFKKSDTDFSNFSLSLQIKLVILVIAIIFIGCMPTGVLSYLYF